MKLKLKNIGVEQPVVRIIRLTGETTLDNSDNQFTVMDEAGMDFGIRLGQSEISCDGAYGTVGIQGNLDYSVGWTIYLNGQDYGRATGERPLEYRSDWEFDHKIRKHIDEGNILFITNASGGDLRVQLKPDTPLANMSMTFIDIDKEYSSRPSENVIVMDDGSINVCLRSSGLRGPILAQGV